MKFSDMKKMYAETQMAGTRRSFAVAYKIAIESLEKIPDEDIKRLFYSGQEIRREVWVCKRSEEDSAIVIFALDEPDDDSDEQFQVEADWSGSDGKTFTIESVVLNLCENTVAFVVDPKDTHKDSLSEYTLKEVFGKYMKEYNEWQHSVVVDADFFGG